MSTAEKSGEILTIHPEGVEPAEISEPTSFNPITAIRKLLDGHKQGRERKVEELAQAVAAKLLTGIVETGMVSRFHDKDTGALEKEIFSGYFKSEAIPDLRVTLWRNYTETEDRAGYERFFGVRPRKLYLQACEGSMEDKSTRCLLIENQWGDLPDQSQIIYLRSWVDESRNQYAQRSIAEQTKFMKQLLEVVPDEVAVAGNFGSPYTPGATRSSNAPGDKSVHNAYWVRDIVHQIPALTPGTVEPTSHLNGYIINP